MTAYLIKRIFYFAAVLAVATGTIWVYQYWWEQNALESPDVVSAVPYTYIERIPVKGVLIWEETVLVSRWDGNLSYPEPGTRRVARGETVAVIGSSSGKMAVRSESVGYFVPGLDGAEGEWRYSFHWPGMAPLPASPAFAEFSSGVFVRRGDPVGKLISQPQELRCVLYADVTPALQKDIQTGFVRVKTEAHGWPGRAAVRASRFLGTKMKLYLTLPFFSLENVKSREIALFLETGEHVGVAVPESSVRYREGKLGVFQVEGNIVKFKEIEGLPVEGHRFFVQKGLQSGNIVVLNAERAKEGKIRLW
ncbi:MAG: hypothetical protein PHX00_01385 [Synergistaceae bacterium]|jgi:hypothetical protein|nr:hypothetical protein [Synergistaceae bacterium]NLD96528.1 efflux RND transporter periplasmic adaptor subunit [Synergistaceae bacterium]